LRERRANGDVKRQLPFATGARAGTFWPHPYQLKGRLQGIVTTAKNTPLDRRRNLCSQVGKSREGRGGVRSLGLDRVAVGLIAKRELHWLAAVEGQVDFGKPHSDALSAASAATTTRRLTSASAARLLTRA